MIHTHVTNHPTWATHHRETFARSVTRATLTAFATAMLFVGTARAADKGPPVIRVSELKPIAEFVTPRGLATLSVLPQTRKEHNGAALVVVFGLMNDKSDKGYAMFTEFNCREHTFSISTVMTISLSNGEIEFEQVMETSEHTKSFTPTDEGKDPWGVKAEAYACTGVLPKFEPGTPS